MDLIDKYLNELTLSKLTTKQEIENHVRDHLSGTNRRIEQKGMWRFVKDNVKGANKKLFDKVWKELIDEDYLIKASGNTYKWEM